MSIYQDLKDPDFAEEFYTQQRILRQQQRDAYKVRWEARGKPELVYKFEKKALTMGDFREMKEWYDSQDSNYIEYLREAEIDESDIRRAKDLKEAKFAIKEVERWYDEQAEAHMRGLYHYDEEDY